MNLQQIFYVLEVVDTGNFSKAAERLHITEPTISQQIKKLEEELHVALFTRSTRKVILTEAGEIFVKKAGIIAEGYASLLSSMRQFARESASSLSVGMSSRSYALGLPRFFREYGQLHSGLSITFRTIPFSNLPQDLLQGNCDFVIAEMSPAMLRQVKPDHYRYEILYRERVQVLAAKGLFPKDKETLTLDEIADMPVIFDSTDPDFERMIQDYYRKSGHNLKLASLQTNDMETMLFAVEQGDAIAFFGTSTSLHYQDRYQYQAFPFSPPVASFVILFYRYDMKLTAQDRTFIQALETWLRDNLE